MYKITTYSNRLYLDEDIIDEGLDIELENNIVEYDRILFAVYNLCLLKEIDKEKYNKILGTSTLFLYVKYKYELNTYYANSIIRIAQGKVKAQKKLQKLYIKNTKEKISTKESAIKKKETFLDRLCKMEERIIKYREMLKKNPDKAKLTPVKGLTFIKVNNNGVILVKDKGNWKECLLGELEYRYILPKIREQKNLIGKYKHRLHNLNKKLDKLQTIRPIIFGTKVFMKEYSNGKHTKLQFLQHKYKSYEISGRCDFPNGNRMIYPEYDTETNTLKFTLTLINNKVIYLNNISFRYRQDELIEVMSKSNGNNDGIAINCRITKHNLPTNRSYYQIATTFDIERTKPYINYNTSTGIIAMDFNLGHIDMTELDGKGNLVNYKTYYYELSNKSYINEISIRKALDDIGVYARSKGKVLACEDLDLVDLKSEFNSDKTKQIVLNRYINSFPYSRFENIVDSLKIKYELDIIKVNPAYTSIIGELKYVKDKKLNTHISASYVIGRRALGFKDYPKISQFKQLLDKEPIKDYTKDWSLWAKLYKLKTA